MTQITTRRPRPTAAEAEQDFQECLELFEQLLKISGKYISGGWSEIQWDAIGGECRTLEDGCNIHASQHRKEMDAAVKAHADAVIAQLMAKN